MRLSLYNTLVPQVIANAPLLTLMLVWVDADIHEVVVSVASANFSGTTSLYVVPGELSDLARRLSGFPSSRDDRRDFVLGQSFDHYGGVRGTLFCGDSIGHLGLHITIGCEAADTSGISESCSAVLHIVPSDLDRFIIELHNLSEEDQSATLRPAT